MSPRYLSDFDTLRIHGPSFDLLGIILCFEVGGDLVVYGKGRRWFFLAVIGPFFISEWLLIS
jgi:hypothetical protein